jgi:predicted ATPase/DNA-binding XRE family transcriptional regulator
MRYTFFIESKFTKYRAFTGVAQRHKCDTFCRGELLVDVSFGEWLKRARKAKGLTQEQLASQVNCSVSALRKIESEERRASIQLVDLFAEIFNIPPQERKSFLTFARGDLLVSGNFAGETSAHTPSSHRSNLPSSTTPLIGREKELATISEYLLKTDIRLVTLIGPPGIGKTRLSIESARETLSKFDDGTFFIPLAPIDDPSLVTTAILQTLGYVETKNLSVLEQIVDGIGTKQMLLVLDNFEHLMDGAAPLVSRLLSACSKLKIMVTSRESLRIPGEWLYSVPTLLVPKEDTIIDMGAASDFPALKLFTERARAVRSDFSLRADNIQTVASICSQLDGLPLAIELIATRIRLMSPQLLLERLNDQFVLSADGMRPEDIRQKTLNSAIDWSYRSLTEEEKNLFVNLSVFSGGFTLGAIETIFSEKQPKKTVPELIALLSDKSLLQRTLDAQGETRFTMLVIIQKFALDRLRQVGGESEMRNKHLAYFLDLAEQADKEAHGPDQIKWMDLLENELDNLRAALNWCLSSGQTQYGLQLFAALAWTWNVRWLPSEARNWFYKLRAMPNVGEYPKNYARVLNGAGLREWRTGNYAEAHSVLEESLAIWRKLGPDEDLGLAEALNRIGLLARWGDSDLNIAESYFNQSLMIYQRRNETWGTAWNLFLLGGVAIGRAQSETAFSLLQQSLELLQKSGDLWGMGRVSQFLGELHFRQENYKKALFYFNQHLLNDEKIRFMDGVSVALANLGDLHRVQGEYAQAEQYYNKSLTMSRDYGMKADIVFILYDLGLLALQQNNYPQALRYFIEFFEIARTVHGEKKAPLFFIGLAAVAAETNQAERASILFGAAQAILDTTGKLYLPFDQTEFERHIQRARDQLGTETFMALQARGRALPLKEAVTFALENQDL